MNPEILAVFGASFVFVFLKAFQQRNVAFDHFKWVIPISLLMAVTEIYVIAQVVTYGWHVLLILAVGFGSGSGAMAAMWLHKRIMR